MEEVYSKQGEAEQKQAQEKQEEEEEEEEGLFKANKGGRGGTGLFKGLFTVSAVDFIERELLWVVEEEEDRGKALYGRIIQNIKSCGLSGLSCHEFRV